MTDQLTQQDVNNTAWAACDTFRGVVDPAQYKDYILVMLFLKYISDLWTDHYAEYKKEYGDNEERVRRKLERERFILPYVEFKDEKTGEVIDRFLADFHVLYERRKAANLGELINIVLDHIEEANKTKLEGVFRNIDFNSEARRWHRPAMRASSDCSCSARAATCTMRCCTASEGSGTCSTFKASALIIRTEVPSANVDSWAWVVGTLMYQHR